MASSDIGCPLCDGAVDTVATAVGLWIVVSLDLAGGRFLIFLLMFAVPFQVLCTVVTNQRRAMHAAIVPIRQTCNDHHSVARMDV